MSEEIKEELNETKTKKCECDGKCIKVFLLGILASFFGCLMALLLFTAATKPKMPPAPMMFAPPQAQQFHHAKLNHGKFKHGEFKGQRPDFCPNFKGENSRRGIDRPMDPEASESASCGCQR